MKLRFKDNSLRLRLNQSEVRTLASGRTLEERVTFPGDVSFAYALRSAPQPSASFQNGHILVDVYEQDVHAWAGSEEIGLYYQLDANDVPLKIAVEKDFECIDGPADERDPDAFPRAPGSSC